MYEIINRVDNDLKISHYVGFDYWNDKDVEKNKSFYVLGGGYDGLERSIECLKNDLFEAIQQSDIYRKKNLVGCELGAGVCWSSSVLYEALNIQRMDYLDFSYNRIANIAPCVLEHYGVSENRVKLYYGSFYETGFNEKSYDFVILTQTLHHAENVGGLMREVKRILKDDGVVIVTGEEKLSIVVSAWRIIKGSIACIVKPNSQRAVLFRQYGCISCDRELGDRVYPLFGYRRIFKVAGFRHARVRSHKGKRSFVLHKIL